MNCVIVNGRVIDPSQGLDRRLSVVVKNGKIAELSDRRPTSIDGEVIDAKGAVVTPGFVDLHVHLREPGEEYKEDIESGSRAAAASG